MRKNHLEDNVVISELCVFFECFDSIKMLLIK